MTTSAFTTELEAVNVLLQVAGEAPVTALTVTGLLPLDQARAVLLEVRRLVLNEGWAFNTEVRYPLPRAVDLTISVPSNAMQVDVDDDFNSSCTPVQRGNRLYDTKNHKYTFAQDLTGTCKMLLEWDDLPQAARHFVMVKAARVYQGRSFGSTTADSFSAADEQAARTALEQSEADEGDYNMLYDNYTSASMLMFRDTFTTPAAGVLY
jgi:hypothetical protein